MTRERKRQLQLHLIHPPKAPAYFCNSLRRGLLSRLKHICHAKQSLKTTLFPTISFLLHSVSQCSWTVKWDHHHGRSDVCLTKRPARCCLWFLPAQNNEAAISRMAYFLPLFPSDALRLPGFPGFLLVLMSGGVHVKSWIQQKAEQPSRQRPPCTGTSGNDNGRLYNLIEGCFFSSHLAFIF